MKTNDATWDSKATILIADDQDTMRSTLARMLSLEGYAYLMAASGGSALEMLETRSVDLALLDINMPGLDGIAVVERIKANPNLAKLPIIMLTGQMDSSSVLRCKVLGVNDYVVKPYKISMLLQRIESALKAQRGESA